MQELFVDKIHFFRFLSMSDKPRLHQLRIITSTYSTVYASLTSWMLPPYGEIPSRKEKYPMLKTCAKSHQLIKHAKISYSIVSLLFRKFLCGTYRNGLNRGNSKLSTPSTSKSANRVSSIPFVRNLHFGILLRSVRYLKKLCMAWR